MDVAIGMFFLGLAIGLVFGLVIHWVFETWETATTKDTRRLW
jgi:L-cystine uptake protein TcyP (sodium:dicarboxylate symporter family)